VQWYRADAECFRWLEAFEVKHAEFERTITYFKVMDVVWSHLAKRAEGGSAAYARKKAGMYRRMAVDGKDLYAKVGEPKLMDRPSGQTLADAVLEWRKTEMRGLVSVNLKWFLITE
jgi:hypothetical protein